MKRFEIMKKSHSSKTLLKMAGREIAHAAYPIPPHPVVSYNNKRWLQIEERCFKLVDIPKSEGTIVVRK